MKVVLDTNVLVSALIIRTGAPARILEHSGALELLFSQETLAELAKVLHYPRVQQRYGLTNEDIDGYLVRLRRIGRIVVVSRPVDVITTDPHDNKFLACASAGAADYIVSGDHHLLDLREYEGIPILAPATFLAQLAA